MDLGNDRARLIRSTLRKNHGELVAAEPCDKISLAQIARHHPRNRNQDGIAGVVAKTIVHFFEIIEINVGNGERPFVALCAVALALHDFIKGPPIVDASERVNTRQLFFFIQAETQLELRLYLPSECLEGFLLARRQLTRHAVKNTNGSKCMVTISSKDRRSRIKSDLWFSGYECARGETFILGGIPHYKQIRLLNGMMAKGNVTRSLVNIQTDLRFEPLPVTIYQADERDGSFASVRGQCSQIVEGLFRRRIQNVVGAQCSYALSLRGTLGRHEWKR